MALSMYLAQLFGLYLVIVSILMITRKDEMTQGVKAFCANPGLFMLSGAIDLLGGLALLIGHPVWAWDWPVVITLLGLLMVVKGILRLGYPSVCISWIRYILGDSKWWAWMSIVTLVIGVFLLINGFAR